MEVTTDGINISINDKQFVKAYDLIEVTVGEIMIFFNDEQLLKVSYQIKVIEERIDISESDL